MDYLPDFHGPNYEDPSDFFPLNQYEGLDPIEVAAIKEKPVKPTPIWLMVGFLAVLVGIIIVSAFFNG